MEAAPALRARDRAAGRDRARPRRSSTALHAGAVKAFLDANGIDRGDDRRRRLPRPDRPASAGGPADRPARRRRGAGARDSAFRWSTISAPPMSRPAGRARRWCRSITARWRARSTRPHPIAVLNLGGVANITFIDGDGDPIACDTGPANALIDDFMRERTGACARRGRRRAAAAGRVDEAAIDAAAGASVLRAAGAEIARPQ